MSDDLIKKVTKLLKDSFGELFGGTPLPSTAMTGSDDWTAWVPSGGGVDLTDIAKAAIATVLTTLLEWDSPRSITLLNSGSYSLNDIHRILLRAFAAEHGIALAPSGEGEGRK